jgi:hypothetical protein
MSLVYQNPRFTWKLSTRASLAHMSQYASPTCDLSTLPEKAKEGGSFERYSAINLQNSHTVEFRFFRGTLAPAGVYRAIETVIAMIEYTRNASVNDASKVSMFREFAAKNAKRFPNLSAFLSGKLATSTETD